MSEDLQKNIQEINKLPGLKKVKDEVKNLVAYLQSSKERKEKGLGDGPALTLHLIFSGQSRYWKNYSSKDIGANL